MGEAILAKENPSKVLYRASPYLLTPETLYETNGDVPNIIFPYASVQNGNRTAIY